MLETKESALNKPVSRAVDVQDLNTLTDMEKEFLTVARDGNPSLRGSTRLSPPGRAKQRSH